MYTLGVQEQARGLAVCPADRPRPGADVLLGTPEDHARQDSDVRRFFKDPKPGACGFACHIEDLLHLGHSSFARLSGPPSVAHLKPLLAQQRNERPASWGLWCDN